MAKLRLEKPTITMEPEPNIVEKRFKKFHPRPHNLALYPSKVGFQKRLRFLSQNTVIDVPGHLVTSIRTFFTLMRQKFGSKSTIRTVRFSAYDKMLEELQRDPKLLKRLPKQIRKLDFRFYTDDYYNSSIRIKINRSELSRLHPSLKHLADSKNLQVVNIPEFKLSNDLLASGKPFSPSDATSVLITLDFPENFHAKDCRNLMRLFGAQLRSFLWAEGEGIDLLDQFTFLNQEFANINFKLIELAPTETTLNKIISVTSRLPEKTLLELKINHYQLKRLPPILENLPKLKDLSLMFDKVRFTESAFRETMKSLPRDLVNLCIRFRDKCTIENTEQITEGLAWLPKNLLSLDVSMDDFLNLSEGNSKKEQYKFIINVIRLMPRQQTHLNLSAFLQEDSDELDQDRAEFIDFLQEISRLQKNANVLQKLESIDLSGNALFFGNGDPVVLEITRLFTVLAKLKVYYLDLIGTGFDAQDQQRNVLKSIPNSGIENTRPTLNLRTGHPSVSFYSFWRASQKTVENNELTNNEANEPQPLHVEYPLPQSNMSRH